MSAQLKSIGEIFSETTELYKSRWLPILAVMLLSTLVILFLVGCAIALVILLTGGLDALTGNLQNMQFGLTGLATGGLLFLLIALAGGWSYTATIAVTVDEELGIMGGLKAGFTYLLPMAWVGFLYSSIVMTGFLLFAVPGMILALSMCLCFYIMIAEGRSGLDTVIASRLYFKGRWWNTFGKFLLVWILYMAINLVPIIGSLVSFVFYPFVLLFMLVVYRDLKENAGEIDTNAGKRWVWGLMAAIGILIPVCGMIGAFVTLAPQFSTMMEQMRQGNFPGQTTTRQQVDPPTIPAQPSIEVVTAPAPEVKRLQSLDGSIIWRDPTGDTNNPLLDIKEITAIAAQDELTVTVTMSHPVAAYFSAAQTDDFSHLLSFYLDTDVDRETGGDPFIGLGRSGYDMGIEVLLVAEPDSPEKGSVNASLYLLDGQERTSLGAMDDSAITISGHTFTLQLPYAMLRIDDKETIRGCYRETDQKQGSGLAKDQLIPLN